jgi:hypothetical protein
MKIVLIAIGLVAINSFATEVEYVDVSKEECQQVCEIYSYGFQPDFLGFCKQIEKCDVLKWDEEAKACELVEAGKLISYPIACRDIPASL